MTDERTALPSDLAESLPVDWESIRAELSFVRGEFPLLALLGALHQADMVTPHLVAEIVDCAEYPMQRIDDVDGWWALHLYAIALLGAMREPTAYQPILTLLRLDEDLIEELLEENITSTVPRSLAAVCPAGEEAALYALASDETVAFWSRSAALQALSIRALEGDLDRDALHAWLVEQAATEAERLRATGEEPELGYSSGYLTALTYSLEEIGAADQLENVRQWGAEGLLDLSTDPLEDTERRLLRDWAECQAEESSEGMAYPTDIIRDIEAWAIFNDTIDADDLLDDDLDDPFLDEPFLDEPWGIDTTKPQTYVREGAKVGRNDPCPCGSGAKYKKCCGA